MQHYIASHDFEGSYQERAKRFISGDNVIDEDETESPMESIEKPPEVPDYWTEIDSDWESSY